MKGRNRHARQAAKSSPSSPAAHFLAVGFWSRQWFRGLPIRAGVVLLGHASPERSKQNKHRRTLHDYGTFHTKRSVASGSFQYFTSVHRSLQSCSWSPVRRTHLGNPSEWATPYPCSDHSVDSIPKFRKRNEMPCPMGQVSYHLYKFVCRRFPRLACRFLAHM